MRVKEYNMYLKLNVVFRLLGLIILRRIIFCDVMKVLFENLNIVVYNVIEI